MQIWHCTLFVNFCSLVSSLSSSESIYDTASPTGDPASFYRMNHYFDTNGPFCNSISMKDFLGGSFMRVFYNSTSGKYVKNFI